METEESEIAGLCVMTAEEDLCKTTLILNRKKEKAVVEVKTAAHFPQPLHFGCEPPHP